MMMARNVEIKAAASDFDAQYALAESIADVPVRVIVQVDTFFHAARGRLKLREFDDGTGELIHYNRPNVSSAKVSTYTRVPIDDCGKLKEALSAALGLCGEVRKRRHLLMAGQTRIHLDRVSGLGDFIELEVVLRPGQDLLEGQAVAESLMSQLRIRQQDLVDCAYVDLLRTQGPR